MKAVVFDNAGTLLQRKTIIKDMVNNKLFFETNTIGMANQNPYNIIIVFQTPTKKLIEYSDYSILDYLKKFPNSFEIAYSQRHFSKEDVINRIDDSVYINEINKTVSELKKYNIQICSGTAMIVNMQDGKINYLYTAGGSLFPDTHKTIDYLKDEGYEIFIASGDNKQSLTKIASILNINTSNIYNTCNINCKQKVVKNLQDKGYYVVMVGNHTNDRLAIIQADMGILTRQQKEEVPNSLLDDADYVIDTINSLTEII